MPAPPTPRTVPATPQTYCFHLTPCAYFPPAPVISSLSPAQARASSASRAHLLRMPQSASATGARAARDTSVPRDVWLTLCQWRALRDEQLSQASGVPGGVFVHANGFIGGHATRCAGVPVWIDGVRGGVLCDGVGRDGAMRMAELAAAM